MNAPPLQKISSSGCGLPSSGSSAVAIMLLSLLSKKQTLFPRRYRSSATRGVPSSRTEKVVGPVKYRIDTRWMLRKGLQPEASDCPNPNTGTNKDTIQSAFFPLQIYTMTGEGSVTRNEATMRIQNLKFPNQTDRYSSGRNFQLDSTNSVTKCIWRDDQRCASMIPSFCPGNAMRMHFKSNLAIHPHTGQ